MYFCGRPLWTTPWNLILFGEFDFSVDCMFQINLDRRIRWKEWPSRVCPDYICRAVNSSGTEAAFKLCCAARDKNVSRLLLNCVLSQEMHFLKLILNFVMSREIKDF